MSTNNSQLKVRRSGKFYSGRPNKISEMDDDVLRNMPVKEREQLHIQDKDDEAKMSRLFYYDKVIPEDGIIRNPASLQVLRSVYLQNMKDIEEFDKAEEEKNKVTKEDESTDMKEREKFIRSLDTQKMNVSPGLKTTITNYQKKNKGDNTEEKTNQIIDKLSKEENSNK